MQYRTNVRPNKGKGHLEQTRIFIFVFLRLKTLKYEEYSYFKPSEIYVR